MRRLTLVGHNRFPIWSPDGKTVAYQSDREGDLAVFMQRAHGAGAVKRLTRATNGEAHVPESWSPDGNHILFSAAKDTGDNLRAAFALWTLSVADGKPTRFGDVQSREPIGSTFSPDGHWVAYHSTPEAVVDPRSPNSGVFIQPFPPTGDRYQAPKLQRDYQPVWDPKGGALLYIPVAARLVVVGVTTKPAVTFGRPEQLPARVTANRLSIDVRAFDVLPDGRFVGLVSSGDADPSSVLAPQIRVVLNWFEELKARVPSR
jgi:dipeptidyl aminopeptidase/acylaminoacyl peptidase